MDRRAYLTAVGTAIAVVSGCSGDQSQQSATPTATPEPAPRIESVGVLSEPDVYEDLDADIGGVGQGGTLVVGTTYEMPVGDGAFSGLIEVRVTDESGTEVDTDIRDISAVVDDGEAYDGRQGWVAFETADWEPGSYTVEVLVNSSDYGTTASADTGVDIVEPLGAGEVDLRLAEYPEEVVAGEEFGWTLGIENLTDRDTSLVTDTVTIDPPGDEPVTFDTSYRLNLPAGEAVLTEQDGIQFPTWGTYTYRIDAVDAEFDFTVRRPE